MNYYVIIFEYSSASVIVETINFKSLNQKNRFDFDSFVNENMEVAQVICVVKT